MKLSNKYYIDGEDRVIVIRAGIELKTYLVGSFIAAMFDAGLDALANNLRITDFQIEELSDSSLSEDITAWSVTLTSLNREDVIYAYQQLREAEPTDDEWTLSD